LVNSLSPRKKEFKMETNRNVVAWLKAGLFGAALAAAIVSCGGSSTPTAVFIPSSASATKFTTTSLVSNVPGAAPNTDPNLVNSLGVAFNPTGFAWVANNGTSTATLYDGNGVLQPLVVTIPPGALGNTGPTGIVFNPTQSFTVTQNGITGVAAFIFANIAGTISAWSPAVNPTSALKMYDGGNGTPPPLYTGLTLASNAGQNYLFAADFRNNTINVFNTNFQRVTLQSGSFSDPNLPTGYAPFGIQAIGNLIYVAYAQQPSSGVNATPGPGLGYLDIYSTSGVLINTMVSTGSVLNAPWGMAMAPANFGTFSNALLVANNGDGKINAFNSKGGLLGQLSNPDGTPISINALWGIAFGNGVNSQPTNTLFFAAGPAKGTQGQYGRIDMQ
jgi:uncharacterized protein (TIGR03118 family)